jgi:hypothetical protein
MAKKKVTQSSITWRVGDGPIHEIPDGATVTFTYVDGTKRTVSLSTFKVVESWKDAGNPSQG